MIGYVCIGTNDLAQARKYYEQLLAGIGARELMDLGHGVMFGVSEDQPMLTVCIPYDSQTAVAGNGNMTAITVDSPATVDKLHAHALELGGTDEGAPGDRGDDFYACFFRDLDGNKLAFYHIG